MAAPSKAYITATSYSNTDLLVFTRPTFYNSNLKTPSLLAAQMLSNVMFYNQLGLKFSFHSVVPNVFLTGNYKRSNIFTSKLGPISTQALYMIANTFPAAYTQVQLRPSFGQLYPLSGQIPY